MTLPRWDSVAALYCRQNSMMLTPCGPRAVPTGGAGVALPACSSIIRTVRTFFLDMSLLSGLRLVDLLDLEQVEIHRRLAPDECRGNQGSPSEPPRGQSPRYPQRPVFSAQSEDDHARPFSGLSRPGAGRAPPASHARTC